MARREYSCLMASFPEEASREFLEATSGLIPRKDLTGDGYECRPHVTILHGVHTPYLSPEAVEIIETHPRFPVVLDNVSLFKHSNGMDVIKVGVDCPDVHALRSMFLNCCEYTLTQKEFIPHVTIGFAKPDTCDYLDGHPVVKGMVIMIEQILFTSKDGSNRFISLGVR